MNPNERTIAKQKKFLIKIVLLQLFFSFLFFVFSDDSNAATIAVSPTSLYYEDVQRNTTIEDMITLFNPNNFSVEYEFVDKKNIIDNNNDDYSISAFSSKNIPIQLTINESIPNGIYEEYLLFKFLTPKKNSLMELTAGIGIKITYMVNDNQIINFSVYKAIIEDTEINSILQLQLDIENTGNINIQPVYNLSIIDGKSNIIISEQKKLFLQPYEQQEFAFYYNTTSLSAGKYTAFVSLIEENEQQDIFFNKELPIQLLPEGTFRRSGILEQFNITSLFNKEKSRLTAIFWNNGSLIADARLTIEIYIDHKLQETLSSEQFLVEKDEKKELVAYYTPKEYGEYKFIAKIVYNKKETNQKEILFSLKNNYLSFFTGNAIALEGDININLIEIIILLGVIIFVAYYLAKKK